MHALTFFNGEFDFQERALEIFRYQYENVSIYNQYVRTVGIDAGSVKTIHDIPFLPISFFKTHKVFDESREIDEVFSSSGTTGMQTSRHYVANTDLYIKSFSTGFELAYGNISQYTFLCLLPSYLERPDSSLVYMCNELVELSGRPQGGFYLDDYDALLHNLQLLKKDGGRVILIGVTFALIELAKKGFSFPELIIVETGGMKGRGREMIRDELHTLLKKAFYVETIHSEYGMTELLSQAWSKGEGIYRCPPWMKVMIRDVNDPFKITGDEVTGGVNVIDLANIHSCSFIATQDLGRTHGDATFEILGRFDNSELRGCNLLV